MIMKFYHARKSISSHEVARELSINQRTTYLHMMKLRKCMFFKQLSTNAKLKGPVQYDEKSYKKQNYLTQAESL